MSIVITIFITFSCFSNETKASNNQKQISYDKVKYALIVSLGPTINQVIEEIYKDKPGGKRSWAPWDTEILEIDQPYGEGGAYIVTVEVHTYVGAHNPPYGYDKIKMEVTAAGTKVLDYVHSDVK